MKKSIRIYFLILFTFITGAATLFPFDSTESTGTDEKKTIDIDFNVGLNVSFNSAQMKIGPKNTPNSLIYSYLALELDADISDFLTLGLLAGYTDNHFKNPVDFERLPLSLGFDREKHNSVVVGMTAASELSLFGDFSLAPRGEFIYFIPSKRESIITLPIVTGEAVSRCSFYQAAIELLGQYDGFSTVTVFFGPQLYFAGGDYKASETIKDITGAETLKFKQKNIFGVVGGINFDLGEHFNVDLKATLLSKTSIAARVFYVF